MDGNELNTYVKSIIKNVNPDIFFDMEHTRDGGQKRKSFRFDKMGEWMINTFSIKSISGVPHAYIINRYIKQIPEDKKTYAPIVGRVARLLIPTISSTKLGEVWKYITDMISDEDMADEKFILFKNGVLDIETMQLHEPSPKFIITNYIPHCYKHDAEPTELVEKFLNDISCNDIEVRILLEEAMGYPMLRSAEIRFCPFMINSSGQNGKSTFLNTLINMLGEENCVKMSPNDLNCRFEPVRLMNKLLAYDDDLSGKTITDSDTWKSAVTGGSIRGEVKNQMSIEFRPYATFLYGGNSFPRWVDTSGGVSSRIVVIPFLARFEQGTGHHDPQMEKKLRDERHVEYMLRLAVDGLIRIKKQRTFSRCEAAIRATQQSLTDSNPLKIFLQEYYPEADALVDMPVQDTYKQYEKFCSDEHSKSTLTRSGFTKKICETYHIGSEQRRLSGTSERARFFCRI